MNSRKTGLGRGLAALIPENQPTDTDASPPEQRPVSSSSTVPIDRVDPNPRQPRDVFDDEELDGLATSIAEMGLLQPVVVRPAEDGRFQLIAGERRLRACKRAGLEEIPVIVRETDDTDLLKEALVENIHRVQLNPLEEAAAYRQLLDDFSFTQEELADRLGKSRPTITNALRLLSLPASIQRKVAAGVLSAGHAKAILALSSDHQKERLASRIVAEGMSVRSAEEAARLILTHDDADQRRTSTPSPRNRLHAPGLEDLEAQLSDALRARVTISMGSTTGNLQVRFTSVDDLERIVGVITRGLSRAAASTEDD